MKTTEQLAPATIAALIPNLTKLTTEQPTTVELEEALKTSKAITRALFEWLSDRYCIQAASRAIPTETAAEREELDRIERAHPIVLGLPA